MTNLEKMIYLCGLEALGGQTKQLALIDKRLKLGEISKKEAEKMKAAIMRIEGYRAELFVPYQIKTGSRGKVVRYPSAARSPVGERPRLPVD